MTRTAKAKGMDDHVHLLRRTVSPHRKSKGDVKGSDDGSAEGTPQCTGKAHHNVQVKVSQEKRRDYLVQTSRKEFANGEIRVIIGTFPKVQKNEAPGGCRFGDKVCVHTRREICS